MQTINTFRRNVESSIKSECVVGCVQIVINRFGNADHFEAVFENPEVKMDVLCELDLVLDKNVVVLSNTSSIKVGRER